ncbi:MAG: amidohydrolase family protein [Marinilabiliaceae bacterium]|jgi:imidazolonepropionase-like amidohydrolase|nr:amidohydrolase family protein [Marinilabiliaceae bacterium]
MKKFSFVFIAFLLFISSLANAQEGDRYIVLKNVNLIDGTGMPPSKNVSILIKNQRIAEIAKSGKTDIPAGAIVIDLKGKTVLPGLIDAHFHMNYPDFSDHKPLLNEAICAYRSVPFLYRHLMGGITTILDAGGYHNVTLMAKKAFNEAYLIGSRPVVVGERINGTGGHGVSRFDMAREADGADEFRKAVREQLFAGADIIKILPPYSKAELQAAIEETHLHQKKVAVHSGIYNKQYAFVRWAAELDADIIMHAYALPDDVIEMMGRKGIYSVPTMTIMMKNQLRQSFNPDNSELHEYEIIFRKLKEAGVKMAVGTDALYEFMNENPGLYFLEVERFVKNGYTNMEAIEAATRIGAEALGIDNALGTIEEGKTADLVVVDGDPLEDIKELRKVVMVIQNGIIVRNDLKAAAR